MHALILEDNPSHSQNIKKTLKRIEDITFDSFATADLASEYIENSENIYPDFAILDVEIGKETEGGIRFAKWLQEEHPSIPFFFLTVHYEDEKLSDKISKELGLELFRYFSKEMMSNHGAFTEFIENFINHNLFFNDLELATHAGGFLIYNDDEYHFIKAKNIYYLEAIDKKTHIVLKNGKTIEYSRHLKQISRQVAEAFPSFYILGKHYCINTSNVDSFKQIGNKGEMFFSKNLKIHITLDKNEVKELRKSGLILNIRPDRIK